MIGTYLYATYFSSVYQVGGLSLPGYALPYIISSTLGLMGLLSVLVFVKTKQDTAESV